MNNFTHDQDDLQTLAMELESYFDSDDQTSCSLYGVSSSLKNEVTCEEPTKDTFEFDSSFVTLDQAALKEAKENFKSHPTHKLHVGEKTFFTGIVGGCALDTGFKRSNFSNAKL